MSRPSTQPPVRTSQRWLIVAVVCALFAGGATVYLAMPRARLIPSAGELAPADDPKAAELFPWYRAVNENCAKYDQAPGDAERAEALSANERLIAATVIAPTRGSLEAKRLSSDGGQMQFTIAVGSVKFKPSLVHPILADTPEFEVLNKLSLGQCVRFSVRTLTAASILERSKVCDKDYFAQFASIETCE